MTTSIYRYILHCTYQRTQLYKDAECIIVIKSLQYLFMCVVTKYFLLCTVGLIVVSETLIKLLWETDGSSIYKTEKSSLVYGYDTVCNTSLISKSQNGPEYKPCFQLSSKNVKNLIFKIYMSLLLSTGSRSPSSLLL